jgi:hypothetical protein
MASSRNNNTTGNYQQEMIQLEKTRTRTYYTGSVINETICYPGDGLLGARNPTLLIPNNMTDIETDLRGIGSTNLVTAKEKQSFTFHPFKILDIQERNRTIMPEPLVIYKYSRPTLH